MDKMRKIFAKALLGSGILVAAGLTAPLAAHADTNVQASNSCDDCSSQSGDSSTTNGGASFTGQNAGPGGANIQDGDNDTDLDQDANSESGAGVAGGQVIGVADGEGDVNVVASNSAHDANAETGDVTTTNWFFAFTGQNAGPGGLNLQSGDNDTDISQSSDSLSGDAISGGQVIGIV